MKDYDMMFRLGVQIVSVGEVENGALVDGMV